MVTLVPARGQQRQEAPSEADTSDVTSGQELREWFPRVRRLCGRNARSLPHDAPHSAEGGHPGAGREVPPRGSGGEGQHCSADFPVPAGNGFSRSSRAWGFITHLRSHRTRTLHRAGDSDAEWGRLAVARASHFASETLAHQVLLELGVSTLHFDPACQSEPIS